MDEIEYYYKCIDIQEDDEDYSLDIDESEYWEDIYEREYEIYLIDLIFI